MQNLICVYILKKNVVKTFSDILFLDKDFSTPNHHFSAKEIRKTCGSFLDTNGRGGHDEAMSEMGRIK